MYIINSGKRKYLDPAHLYLEIQPMDLFISSPWTFYLQPIDPRAGIRFVQMLF